MASSSAAGALGKKYDMFLNFRGSDIRQGFLSHLRKALLDEKIEAFDDEQLERGAEIDESLLVKIEESHIALVIFSQNYAFSRWCLDELLKIAECRKSTGQIVIPVFYCVDPSHVQDLTGSYGDAMAQLRKKFDESLVEKWGNVLKDTASLSGLVYSNVNTESSLIEEIIKHTLEKLNCLYPRHSDCDGRLVGIESRVEKVMSLLCGPEDVCVVGIWGEGGIGKTTLAQATFDRICSQFDSQCFFGNVREKSEKSTTDAIRNEVVSKLFGTSDFNMSRKWLSCKKVILVLDDVSDLDQIKLIMRYRVDFGCGSRIIVTSRDSHLLKNLGAKIYAVEKQDDLKALQLFCLNAFNERVPQNGFLELCKKAVKYAQGLPLALEVLGCNLFQRSAEEWENEFEKLKGASDQKIHKILRISYDGLCDEEKDIFLDIACFFKGSRRDEVERLLDARGSKIGISRLSEKALISIRYDKYIDMHDLIAQIAKDIICEEKTLGKRRWLWNPEDIRFLLTREMRTEAVKGIFADMSKTGNINLSRTSFQKLYNLRYLHFYSRIGVSPQLYAPQGLEYLPEGLRYLYWDGYPSKSLLLTSCLAEKLVELVIRDSQLEELWNGVLNLPSLKKLDLSGNTKLIKVPDLSAASNLEELCLVWCKSLVEIPSSLKYLSKLAQLELGYCSKLESLPDGMFHLKSLWFLDVSYCGNLHRLPQDIVNLNSLVSLQARETGIKELPDSVCNLKECKMLYIGECDQMPQNFGETHFLAGEGRFKTVPHRTNIPSIDKFRQLILRWSGGLILPLHTGSFPHLTNISLNNLGMSEFPIGLCSATSLEYLFLRGNHFKSIPESIQHVLKLRMLDLNNCKELKYLPESLKSLPELRYLNMRDCISLDQNQCSNIMNHFMVEYKKGKRQSIPIACYPGSEVPEKMTYKNERGSSVSFSFKLLQHVLNHELEFYACLISDRPIPSHEIKVILKNESGLGTSVDSGAGGSGLRYLTIKLWDTEFGREFFVKGREYAVEFQFLLCTHLSRKHYSSEGITKCGVFPLFDHQTVE